MRTKAIVPGLSNTQKIRVILNGVGFYTQVKNVEDICNSEHRAVVLMALDRIVNEKIWGFGAQTYFYDSKMNQNRIDYQVDLV